jgi:hypothetical protein
MICTYYSVPCSLSAISHLNVLDCDVHKNAAKQIIFDGNKTH